MKKLYFFNLLILFIPFIATAQTQQDYSNEAVLAKRVKSLSDKYPQFVKSRALTQTIGGKAVWMLTVGTDKADLKPAVAVVGGVDGKHLLGVELAIGFAEKLLAASSTDSIKNLLNTQTFYVFPNMSPDATAQYFAAVKAERGGNATSTDDDRDGKMNEDDFDDLNGDGKISWMRVKSPVGKYKLNNDDPRSLILADPAKGEVGGYELFAEGIDNDKDGSFHHSGRF